MTGVGGINPYRRSVSPYFRPIKPPLADPNTATARLPNVNCEWINVMIGALAILEEQATWDTEDVEEMSLAIQRSAHLRAMLSTARNTTPCAHPLVEFACTYPFNIDDQGWTLTPPNNVGAYVPGNYWISTFFDSHSKAAIQIRHALSGYQVLTAFALDYTSTGDGSGGNNVARLEYYTASGGTVLHEEQIQTGSHTLLWNGYLDMFGVLGIQIDLNSGDSAVTINALSAAVFGLAPNNVVPC